MPIIFYWGVTRTGGFGGLVVLEGEDVAVADERDPPLLTRGRALLDVAPVRRPRVSEREGGGGGGSKGGYMSWALPSATPCI